MATIRDVVEALSRRAGVDAVVVVSRRDGLPIDSRTKDGMDADGLAALLPSVITSMAQLGQAGGRGEFGTGVLEFAAGLLLDLHLPDGSGLDLLRELRGAAGTRALPVMVLTAEGDERVLAEAERLGAALLTKPFSPKKLTARIAAMLGDAPPAGDDPA